MANILIFMASFVDTVNFHKIGTFLMVIKR